MKRYLLLATFGTLVCWIAWVLVLFNFDPFVSGFIGLTSFSVSLFLALLGTFSLLGFLFRKTFSRDGIAYHHIGVSIRQGFFLSLMLVGTLILRGTGFYTWWTLAFLLAGFTVLESFFLVHESS